MTTLRIELSIDDEARLLSGHVASVDAAIELSMLESV